MKTIVVGIDGSEHGEAALAFAAEEAALRGAHLLIVCAWQTPMVVDPGGLFPPQAFEGLAENARSIAEAAVARVAELQPLGTCEGKTVEGQPAAVLLKEAEHAVMIVVGSRGRGGFANLLLGSVTQQVVHHAPCPVVVVR